ncbi:hypothetical protein C0992_007184 [Termitomyces sp. T32_za158]|nr:hypothetical protein C0992_007184 [Termitomyces sp. T32_za158]
MVYSSKSGLSGGLCPQVDILLGAWLSGTTFFRKMENDEWAKWREDYLASATASNGAAPTDPCPDEPMAVDESETASEDTSSQQPSTSQQAPVPITDTTRAVNNIQFIHSSASGTPAVNNIQIINSSASGTPLAKPVKKRKQRSDAGKKRGPRKKSSSSTAVPPSS